MENQTEEQKKQLAREYLFQALQNLKFNVATLAEFFCHVAKVHGTQKDLLKSIEGGTRYPRGLSEVTPVGEWGNYYIVKTSQLESCVEKEAMAFKRGTLMAMAQLFGTLLKTAPWFDNLKKFCKVRGVFKPSIVRLKKFKDSRILLRFTTIQVLLCGDQMEEKHVTDFRKYTIPYWRKALETQRVQLHLMGKHTYNREIQQVDIFLRIMETSN